MKQILSALAVVVFSICSGCATTGTESAGTAPTTKSVLAAAKDPALQCTAGWHACVCDKEAKCCSFRKDCECGSAGEAICR
jgi:hypothetical protein